MKNHWTNKKPKSKPKSEITKQFVITWAISDAINAWLHQKGDDVHRYCIFLDRVCDINTVVKEAMQKAEELIKEHKGEGLDF